MIGKTNSKGFPTNVNTISDLRIYKTSDACGTPFTTSGIWITPIYAEAFDTGFVIQGDVSSFSTFYFGNSAAITLPLTLLNFNGSMVKNQANLKWTTANEKNTSYFGIERSTDGSGFKTIGKVNANGNTSGESQYYYIDGDACNQLSSTVYYRLKMTDENGNYSYSNVIQLQCSASGLNVDVYPNPIHHELKVRISLASADNIQIQVVDMQGRIVHMQSKYVSAGTNEISIDTQRWPAQMYTVKVTASNSDVLITKNVVKQ
jgi:hypothetical protein